MSPDEKEKLLELLHDKQRWCKDAEARDQQGNAVRYDDESAVAWDLTGATCFLFGWQRACELFRQLDRHITGRRRRRFLRQNTDIASMTALQDFNDLGGTTYEAIATQLNSMPVWRGNRHSVE
jgi:hypothetical protein